MAKWGEGDPRWIVEERPDAANVNNWHWTEKDASLWSTDKLKSLLSSVLVSSVEIGILKLSDLNCLGEASVSNRKGKIIILYDWSINGKIEGKLMDAGDDMKSGTVEIKNFSFENNIEDIELTVNIKPCSSALIFELRKQIISKLEEYVEALSKDFADGLLLPTTKTKFVSPVPTAATTSASDNQLPVTSKSTNQGDGLKISTKKAKITDSFKCEANDLYNVFVTEELVKAFTRSDAKVNGQKGGQFTLMNGHITGEYVQLERPTKIIKKWRSKEWPPGHFSTVTIELSQKDDCTDLTLIQTGIPSTFHDRTKEGWKRHIFEPIKSTFGYGSRIY